MSKYMAGCASLYLVIIGLPTFAIGQAGDQEALVAEEDRGENRLSELFAAIDARDAMLAYGAWQFEVAEGKDGTAESAIMAGRVVHSGTSRRLELDRLDSRLFLTATWDGEQGAVLTQGYGSATSDLEITRHFPAQFAETAIPFAYGTSVLRTSLGDLRRTTESEVVGRGECTGVDCLVLTFTKRDLDGEPWTYAKVWLDDSASLLLLRTEIRRNLTEHDQIEGGADRHPLSVVSKVVRTGVVDGLVVPAEILIEGTDPLAANGYYRRVTVITEASRIGPVQEEGLFQIKPDIGMHVRNEITGGRLSTATNMHDGVTPETLTRLLELAGATGEVRTAGKRNKFYDIGCADTCLLIVCAIDGRDISLSEQWLATGEHDQTISEILAKLNHLNGEVYSAADVAYKDLSDVQLPAMILPSAEYKQEGSRHFGLILKREAGGGYLALDISQRSRFLLNESTFKKLYGAYASVIAGEIGHTEEGGESKGVEALVLVAFASIIGAAVIGGTYGIRRSRNGHGRQS